MKVLTKDGLSYFWSKIKNFLDGKLDTISDLNTIRDGAALGATALLSYTETDPTVPSHVKSITLTNINAWNEAEANVQSDWNQTTTTADDYIKNKPDIPDDLSDLNDDSTHRLVTDTEKATWNGKQDTLVSGTNLKTINNESLLGSGNISIQGGGSDWNISVSNNILTISNQN